MDTRRRPPFIRYSHRAREIFLHVQVATGKEEPQVSWGGRVFAVGGQNVLYRALRPYADARARSASGSTAGLDSEGIAPSSQERLCRASARDGYPCLMDR